VPVRRASRSLYSSVVAAQLKTLVLCDFAQIREGLLFVQSGGLTRLLAPTFPAMFNCHVGCLVYLPPDEAGAAHEMVMKVKAAETATLIATVQVALHETAPPPGLAPGEGRQVPIVVPLGAVAFPSPGEYDLHVDLDDQFAGDLSFRVVTLPV
jgi:hypothetical protein